MCTGHYFLLFFFSLCKFNIICISFIQNKKGVVTILKQCYFRTFKQLEAKRNFFFQTFVQIMINEIGLMSISQMVVSVKTQKNKVTFRITTCIVTMGVAD